MKTYQYKPDAQASAFHRHAENASTRLRVGLVLAGILVLMVTRGARQYASILRRRLR